MNMKTHSTRSAAKIAGISHTAVANMRQLYALARERGVYDELHRRIMAGEKTSHVLEDLIPDFAAERRFKQHLSSWKSTTRKLLHEHGIQVDQLVALVIEADDTRPRRRSGTHRPDHV